MLINLRKVIKRGYRGELKPSALPSATVAAPYPTTSCHTPPHRTLRARCPAPSLQYHKKGTREGAPYRSLFKLVRKPWKSKHICSSSDRHICRSRMANAYTRLKQTLAIPCPSEAMRLNAPELRSRMRPP